MAFLSIIRPGARCGDFDGRSALSSDRPCVGLSLWEDRSQRRSAFLSPSSGSAPASRVRWETRVDLMVEGFGPVLVGRVAFAGRCEDDSHRTLMASRVNAHRCPAPASPGDGNGQDRSVPGRAPPVTPLVGSLQDGSCYRR